MLNGEMPPSCLKCYKEEAAGHNSKRMWETHYWSQRVDVDRLVANTDEDGSVPPELTYIDHALALNVNLRVMCSPMTVSVGLKIGKQCFQQLKMQVLKKLCSGKTKAVTTAVAIIGINKILFLETVLCTDSKHATDLFCRWRKFNY